MEVSPTSVRDIKTLSRCFTKFLKTSHSEFIWSKLCSYLPIPTNQEYQEAKATLLKISLHDEDYFGDDYHTLMKTASGIFGKTLAGIIKNKVISGTKRENINTVDSDDIIDDIDSSDLTEESQNM